MLSKWLAQLALTPNNDKPLVAVSACLLGRAVRYDGEHKRDAMVADVLAKHLRLAEICPEVAIGMPVPRPPIQVIEISGQRSVRGVAPPHTDVSAALQQFGRGIDDRLCGVILKARSPSCGVGTTPVLDVRGDVIRFDDGEFSRTLAQRFPCLPRSDESTLQTSADAENFLLRVHLYRHWRNNPQLATVYAWREQLEPLSDGLTDGTRHWLETLAAHSQ